MASLHFDAGKAAERKRVVAYIRARGASAVTIGKRGRSLLTEAEAARLDRWLEALAGDIAQGLHEPD